MRKIDIYLRTLSGHWYYYCSTNKSKSCKEALARFFQFQGYGLDRTQVRARFAK